jgi:tryptophanyl-tRNA synthetase
MEKLTTGITVSGDITLGNYLGVIKRLNTLSKTYDSNIFVANLHGLTTPHENFDIKDFKDKTRKIAAIYVASGIDLKNSNIFIQSTIPEITELAYLIAVHTTMGELTRMTQFKDKSSKSKLKNNTEIIPTGLLIYPTLMAADILIFNSEVVPTGVDQKQHIELTRNIAERFNNKYGKTFTVPKPMIDDSNARKIMALQEPTKKMSKSDMNHKNTIFLLDDEATITKKLKQAITDSDNTVKYDLENKPGVSNLITIYSAFTDMSIKDIEAKFSSLGYKEFKEDLIKEVLDELLPLQKKYNDIINGQELDTILEQGSKNVRKEAIKTLSLVKERLGLK